MPVLREARKWLTGRVDDLAVSCAPWLSARSLDRVGPLIAWCGPRLPVLGRLAAQNMSSAGLYSPQIHRDYFANVGAHLAGALQALRCAGRSQQGPQSDLKNLAENCIQLDDSVQALAEAAGRGRGAILVGPHISNYLLNLTRLNQAVPLTIYLRHSKDSSRQQAKQRWYRASGVSWISEPAGQNGPLGRLGQMSAVLRAGRVLFITPDLAKKRGEGVAVRLLGREVYLPAGAAALAARTGAPLFALHARKEHRVQKLFVRGPFNLDSSLLRSRDPSQAGRRTPALIAAGMQWFADEFERFLREQPALWYLWADKRWTRVFRGDPRYVGPGASL